MLGTTIRSHQDLERQRLRGFDAPYGARRLRVLAAEARPVVIERLDARPEVANAKPHGRADPADNAEARLINAASLVMVDDSL